MALTVKKIVLWRKEVENRTGILANALAPLANAGTDIHVVMAYRFPGHESKAVIELYPVTGRKSVTAERSGIQRVNRPGSAGRGRQQGGPWLRDSAGHCRCGDQHGFSPGPGGREKVFGGFWI